MILTKHSRSTHGVESLIAEIDEYLASQAEAATHNSTRRNSIQSVETMFVDMDSTTGNMHVSYRNRDPSFRDQPFEEPGNGIDVEIRHREGDGGILVTGTDHATGFAYDYDGHVVHVHRDPEPRDHYTPSIDTSESEASSPYSEYYELEATTYEAGTSIIVSTLEKAEEEEEEEKPPTSNNPPTKKNKKTLTFLKRLIVGFEKCDIWTRFKDSEQQFPNNKKLRKPSSLASLSSLFSSKPTTTTTPSNPPQTSSKKDKKTPTLLRFLTPTQRPRTPPSPPQQRTPPPRPPRPASLYSLTPPFQATSYPYFHRMSQESLIPAPLRIRPRGRVASAYPPLVVDLLRIVV